MRFRGSPIGGLRDLNILTLTVFTALSHISSSYAISFTSVTPPALDLSQLGRVALVGDFDSVSLYDYVGQTETNTINNGSQSLLSRYPSTGAFTGLQSSDGAISSLTSYFERDGSFTGVIVGGNFSTLGGVAVEGIALYIPNNNTVLPLEGLTGRVNNIFYDQARQTALVGGSFSGGNSTNAIAWAGEWQNLPFEGFDGPVSSIAQLPNGNILFGGRFSRTKTMSASTPVVTSGSSTGVPQQTLDQQVVNIGGARVTASGSTTNAGFNDPKNIICKTSDQTGAGNEWLLADDTPGSWAANFSFAFAPSRLRLYNSQATGYATKTWRFVEEDSGGILNFTYYGMHGLESCTATCPLANNASYQDFYFVNYFALNAFRIYVSDWYGRGGGLGGIELFQDDIYVSAIQDFNEPQCDGVSPTAAQATRTGSWRVTPSGDSYAEYLSTTLLQGTSSDIDASIVFYPNIKQSGNYSVLIYTPGCISDNSCTNRGIVNITGNLGNTNRQSVSGQVYQTNNYHKYDQVYLGYVQATSSSFKPSVTLTPAAGQSGPLAVVAQSIRFELISATTDVEGGTRPQSDASSAGLNGLFEYNPSTAGSSATATTSPYDVAGLQLDTGAEVYALTMADNITYVGGAFSSTTIRNIMALQNGKVTALPGLNQPVQSLFANSSYLYAAGNFTDTVRGSVSGLRNVAVYSLSSETWTPLGAGVNGIVYNIVPLTINISLTPVDCLAFSGYFDQVHEFDNFSAFAVDNLAIWVPQENNWLQNLHVASIAVSGRLTSQVDIPGSDPLFAGAVDSQTLGISGAVGLSTSGTLALEQLPIDIQSQSQTTTDLVQKRAILGENTQGIVSGLYYTQNNLNLTILGGQFTAQASNGSIVSNLAIINGTDNDSITGLATSSSSSGTILALATQGTSLFVGGIISSGMLIYDLQSASLIPTQPPPLTGETSSINSIAVQPYTSAVYVGGSFGSAGSLSCPALCVYNTSAAQWNSPGSGLSSTSVITSLQWASSTYLIIAGNMTINGEYTTFASYNSTSRLFTSFPGADKPSSVPGQISTVTPTSNDYISFFLAGTSLSSPTTSFLTHYSPQNSTYTPITGLLPSSIVSSLQLLRLTSPHATTSLIPADQTLLVTGQLQLAQYGNVSAALYNGTAFTPFLLSTSRDGSPGTVRGVFVQNPQNLISGDNGNGGQSTSGKAHLATGYVVLIALAISLALIFLLVLAGILVEHLRRKREGYVPANTRYTAYDAAPVLATGMGVGNRGGGGVQSAPPLPMSRVDDGLNEKKMEALPAMPKY